MFAAFWRWLERRRAHLARRRLTPAHALGRIAEDLACHYLEQRGYIVIDRNWFDRKSLSEIDIIARHEGHLVFVEVKARTTDEFAAPETALHAVKRAALLRGIAAYSARAKTPIAGVRFDVVTVVFTDPPRITLFADERLRHGRRRNAVC
jgi:putative endonuclease